MSMQTKEQVFETLKSLITNNFEIGEESVKLEAHLYDDFGIDSIDAIDLLAEVRDVFGKKIEPNDFKQIRTVSDVVDTIHRIIHQPLDA